MNDSYGDGLCCEYGEGSWMVLDDDGNVMVESDGVFEESETDQFCTEWSSVGLASAKLNIFPNPANSTLNIETTSTGGEFTITDASGRIMTKFSHSELTQTQVDVNGWAEGMYIVTWHNDKGERSVNQVGIIH